MEMPGRTLFWHFWGVFPQQNGRKAENGVMKPIWFWAIAGLYCGFSGFWAAGAAAGAAGIALGGRGRRAITLAAVLSGLTAGAAGAALERPPFAGGRVMKVARHVQDRNRKMHLLQDGGRWARRELPETWAPGSRVWVPDHPRLPALALPGAVSADKTADKTADETAQTGLEGSLVDALTRGSPPPEKLRARLRHAGLSHVLALSGLHLSIVTWMVLALAGLLHRLLPPSWGVERRFLETPAGIAFAWFYHAATGAHVSTTRAALMLTLWLPLSRFWGAGGSFSALVPAAAILWAWDPAAAADPAFQLSVAAVAGMGLALRTAPGARGFWQAALVSAGATAATLPIVQWHFGRISPMFLINNIIFLPFFSLIIIPAAFIIQATVMIIPGLGTPLRDFADASIPAAARAMQAWNALWPEWTAAGTALWTLLLAAAITWGARSQGRKRALPLLCAVLALACLPFGRVDESNLRLTFFAGGGESVLVRFPHGENWLVDAGSPGLESHLARRGVVRLHRVILTHNHDDHIRELFRVAKTLEVGEVWVGPRFPAGWKRRLETAGAQVRPIPLAASGPGIEMRLLSLSDERGARAPDFWSENDASLAVELVWRGRILWFMGDTERAAERELTRNCTPHAVDLMKVAHHGRATSTGPEILACVKPRAAVICGGPADPGVVHRLKETGAEVEQVNSTGEIELTPCNLFECKFQNIIIQEFHEKVSHY